MNEAVYIFSSPCLLMFTVEDDASQGKTADNMIQSTVSPNVRKPTQGRLLKEIEITQIYIGHDAVCCLWATFWAYLEIWWRWKMCTVLVADSQINNAFSCSFCMFPKMFCVRFLWPAGAARQKRKGSSGREGSLSKRRWGQKTDETMKAPSILYWAKKVKVDVPECQVSMDHLNSLNYMLIYVIFHMIYIYIYIVWFLCIVTCHDFYLFSMWCSCIFHVFP